MATQTQPSPYNSLFPGYAITEPASQHGNIISIDATQIALGRKVTIWLLTPQANNDDNARQGFQKHIKTLSSLHHEHIPTIHNFGKIDNTLYAILSPIPVNNIAEITRNQPVHQAEAATLTKKIGLALHHAHLSANTHGNICPTSILIDAQGNPALTTFQNTPHTDTSYSAPEIRSGNSEPTIASDIYALGVLLYTLLTGTTPAGTNRPPSSFQDTDPRFDTIFVKATHRNPKLRYQSVEEMTADLEHISSAINGKTCSSLALISSTPTKKRHSAAAPVRLAHPPTTPITSPKISVKSPTKKHLAIAAAVAFIASISTLAISNANHDQSAHNTSITPETIITTPPTPAPTKKITNKKRSTALHNKNHSKQGNQQLVKNITRCIQSAKKQLAELNTDQQNANEIAKLENDLENTHKGLLHMLKKSKNKPTSR